ncbi:hypothetical protein JCM19233_4506 [Vibrio astriarenae]|nr:hypothetical protein JCM19233_4506 [Vibrio sp. C7]
MRFGLNGREPLSLASVALQVGVSNEAIRQRQKQAIVNMTKQLRLVSPRE